MFNEIGMVNLYNILYKLMHVIYIQYIYRPFKFYIIMKSMNRLFWFCFMLLQIWYSSSSHFQYYKFSHTSIASSLFYIVVCVRYWKCMWAGCWVRYSNTCFLLISIIITMRNCTTCNLQYSIIRGVNGCKTGKLKTTNCFYGE